VWTFEPNGTILDVLKVRIRGSNRVQLVSAMRLSVGIIASSAASWFLVVLIGEAIGCNPNPLTWKGVL
jgi:hypothetical protein